MKLDAKLKEDFKLAMFVRLTEEPEYPAFCLSCSFDICYSLVENCFQSEYIFEGD